MKYQNKPGCSPGADPLQRCASVLPVIFSQEWHGITFRGTNATWRVTPPPDPQSCVPKPCQHPAQHRLSLLYKLGSLSLPKPSPSLASAVFWVAGAEDLQVGIREGHACQGECNEGQGEEEGEREEGIIAWDGSGWQWLARLSSGLQATESGPSWHILTVCLFEMHHIQTCFLCSSF